MRASDAVLHKQLSYFAKSIRQASSVDRIVIIATFYDEEKESDATLTVYDVAPDQRADDEPKEMTALIHAILRSAATTMSLSQLRLIIENTETGEQIPFKVKGAARLRSSPD